MPMTVITVRNAPTSLRGDLTIWMQEISTGVYIGNFNTRIREELWERVLDSIGSGEATLSYHSRTENGYMFETNNTNREKIDFDGIPLVLIPQNNSTNNDIKQHGFSNAAKFHKSRQFSTKGKNKKTTVFVVVDIEVDKAIIRIDAIKTNGEENIYLDQIVYQGERQDNILSNFVDFIGNYKIIGYDTFSEIQQINQELIRIGKKPLINQFIDIKRLVKREEPFLSDYNLETVLQHFKIDDSLDNRKNRSQNILALTKKINNFMEKVDQ
jgi:CRISPR-associated protein Cas2